MIPIEKIKENSVSFIVAFLIVIAALGSYIIYAFNDINSRSSNLKTQAEKLQKKQESLYRQEKDLAVLQVKMENKETNLVNKEKELNEKIKEISFLKKEVDAKNKELQETKVTLSESNLDNAREQEISRLIQEFSSYGISLEDMPACKEKEQMKNYNKAKIIFSQIESLTTSSNHLYALYKDFIQSNKPALIWSRSCG